MTNIRRSLLSRDGIVELKSENPDPSVKIRIGTSDLEVYDQVFKKKEYSKLGLEDVHVVVDAGANIGASSVLFAEMFPSAKVISIEPDSQNLELLKANTQRYDRICVVEAGLWSKNTHLRIVNPSDEPWMLRFEESRDSGGVEAVSIPWIIENFDIDTIDVLKMDIEGAEKEVLSGHVEWISRVKTLIVETHDRYQPGSSAVVEELSTKHDFQKESHGENIVLTRKNKGVPAV
jgi:FkbM family methyltransferase